MRELAPQIRDLYDSTNKSIRQIAEHLNTSPDYVRAVLGRRRRARNEGRPDQKTRVAVKITMGLFTEEEQLQLHKLLKLQQRRRPGMKGISTVIIECTKAHLSQMVSKGKTNAT